MIKISLGPTFSLRALGPIEKQLSKVAEWGFDGIELQPTHVHPLDYDKAARKELKELIESSGLETPIYSPFANFGDPNPLARRREVQFYKEYIELSVDFSYIPNSPTSPIFQIAQR